MQSLDEGILTSVIAPRAAQSHKGDYGRVCLIGGNSQYGGAIIMAAEASVYSGAGLTTVITHPINHTALHSRLPEAMVVDWYDNAAMAALLPQMDVIVIGPGLGLGDESLALLKFALSCATEHQYWVIDGSAITLLASHNIALHYPQHIIYTPHQMEWARLSGLPLEAQTEVANRRIRAQLNSTVVLKKHHSEIYSSQGEWRLPIGSPAMATGGMGDTLTGIIAGFLAQFPHSSSALFAAVYIHSFIGDSLAQQRYVVLPTPLNKQLPEVMQRFCCKR